MQNNLKTSCDTHGLVIENPAQRLAPEVVQALDTRRAAQLDILAIEQEPLFTREMRQEAAELRLQSFREFAGNGNGHNGHDLEVFKSNLREAALKRSDQVGVTIREQIARKATVGIDHFIKVKDMLAVPPEPVDHSFWWARTQATAAPAMRAEFSDDGLYFSGGPKVNNHDGEIHANFGAVASFELKPERMPVSPSGNFISSPHVELFGGVVAYAPNWDILQGNGIASCDMHLRQTLFQWGFGQTGPEPRVIAEAKVKDDWHIYLMNAGASRHLAMPGFKPLPAVTYRQNQLLPAASLWSEIEVRFEIYLNTAGALLWCDPNVLLRTFHWAPAPLP